MFDFSKQRLLVIAPHPDDEVIGCGALIAKVKNAGGEVYVLYLTVGNTRDFTDSGFSTGVERQSEIKSVAKYFRFDGWDLKFLGDNYHLQLDKLGQKTLMDVIERESTVSLEKIRPTTVALPSITSYNQDHKIVASAAFASLRPASRKSKHFVPIVLSYESPAELWSLKKQDVNFWIEIEKSELEKKLGAIKLYKSQDRTAPNPRSAEILRTLSTLRGSQIGLNFAEAFQCLRMAI